ncbi:UNK family protein [Megaselia abdita]
MSDKINLATQAEKPNHYTYLKEFRVEQCTAFLQHKCSQHRPFICFNWHFQNQRRRRPVRKRDGTFNYSADNYCTKYDETTGICPEGDDCPFLHRTAGDTERRYHLRYYKTCMCVHDTDARGYCVKNGHHCAFAHGLHDQRPPVYDIKELEALQTVESNGTVSVLGVVGAAEVATLGVAVAGTISASQQNALDKERNLMNEDPKWQDTNYVLANYKTELCKRPPRLCRQGYACPQYHNSKDKRRSPRKFKYRSTPCPNVKHGEEWGEPSNCEALDNCQYCHTRTEQQFHPEIYKSTKCNDVQQAGYCPRSVFCAFAHVEQEKPRDIDGPSTNLVLSEMINNVLPELNKKDSKLGLSNNDNTILLQSILHNGNGDTCESTGNSLATTLGSTSTTNNSNALTSRAPGAQLQHQKQQNSLIINPTTNGISVCSNNSNSSHTLNNSITPFGPDFTSDLTKQLMGMESDSNQGKMFSYGLNLAPIEDNPLSAGLLQASSAPINIPSSPISNSISVNIPGGNSMNYSPTANHSNLFSTDIFNMGSNSNQKMNNLISANHQNSNDSFLQFQQSVISPGFGDNLSISPSLGISELRESSNLFDQQSQQQSSSNQQSQNSTSNHYNNLSNLYEEKNAQIKKFKRMQSQVDECNKRANIAELQRDAANKELKDFKDKCDLTHNSNKELRNLPITKLKQLKQKLQTDLEEVEKVLYLETAKKCMKCEEYDRSVTLSPCNHYVVCDTCSHKVEECPYCNIPISKTTSQLN